MALPSSARKSGGGKPRRDTASLRSIQQSNFLITAQNHWLWIQCGGETAPFDEQRAFSVIFHREAVTISAWTAGIIDPLVAASHGPLEDDVDIETFCTEGDHQIIQDVERR